MPLQPARRATGSGALRRPGLGSRLSEWGDSRGSEIPMARGAHPGVRKPLVGLSRPPGLRTDTPLWVPCSRMLVLRRERADLHLSLRRGSNREFQGLREGPHRPPVRPNRESRDRSYHWGNGWRTGASWRRILPRGGTSALRLVSVAYADGRRQMGPSVSQATVRGAPGTCSANPGVTPCRVLCAIVGNPAVERRPCSPGSPSGEGLRDTGICPFS